MEMSGVGSELRNIFGCHGVFIWDSQRMVGQGTVLIYPLEEQEAHSSHDQRTHAWGFKSGAL